MSDCDLAMHALAAETLQAVQHRVLVDPPQINRDVDDFCRALTDGSVNVDSEVVELELLPPARESDQEDLRDPGAAHIEDKKCTSKANISQKRHVIICAKTFSYFTLSTTDLVLPDW